MFPCVFYGAKLIYQHTYASFSIYEMFAVQVKLVTNYKLFSLKIYNDAVHVFGYDINMCTGTRTNAYTFV